MTRRPLLLLIHLGALGALAGGCQPTSQLVIHIDSDAIVPPRPGAPPDPMRPNWLFDRLRVELFDADAPVAARDFELDEGLFLDGKVSFGVAPQLADSALTARVRLFRGDHAISGQPLPSATIDTTYAVPPVDSSTVQQVSAFLRTDDVGKPRGPITFDPGEPGPSQINTWPGATVIPCKGTAGPDEVCVPGGAFWMGDPILKGLAVGEDADQERLVIVSPFFIDLREVTVADSRVGTVQPNPWNGLADPDQYDTWCTYTDGASAADPTDAHAAYAANCISYETAALYCKTHGKTLPSEAQYEFVASGRGAENSFPWGNDEPVCADAVWGFGGIGVLLLHFDTDCRINDDLIGAHAPGTGARDRVTLIDATTGQSRQVVDLGGNLSEWSLDAFVDESDPFWSAPGVRKDPVYTTKYVPGVELDRSVRGGTWYDVRVLLRAGYRRAFVDTDIMGGIYDYFNIGWRCARPG